MLCFSFGAAMKPTPLCRVVQRAAEGAIVGAQGSLKAGSITMDVPLSQLSESLSGCDKHLSLQRLSLLGEPFLVAFCKRVMRALGGVALDAHELRAAEVLAAERRQEIAS